MSLTSGTYSRGATLYNLWGTNIDLDLWALPLHETELWPPGWEHFGGTTRRELGFCLYCSFCVCTSDSAPAPISLIHRVSSVFLKFLKANGLCTSLPGWRTVINFLSLVILNFISMGFAEGQCPTCHLAVEVSLPQSQCPLLPSLLSTTALIFICPTQCCFLFFRFSFKVDVPSPSPPFLLFILSEQFSSLPWIQWSLTEASGSLLHTSSYLSSGLQCCVLCSLLSSIPC